MFIVMTDQTTSLTHKNCSKRDALHDLIQISYDYIQQIKTDNFENSVATETVKHKAYTRLA